MIPSRNIRNTRVTMPILNMLVDAPFLEKTTLKALYPQWKGESIAEIKEKHSDNPYRVRIGTPNTDKAMQADHALFIQSYLSYNPITKQLEKRELLPYRNVEKVYIGEQRIDEHNYGNYTLFINGSIVAEDLILLNNKQSLLEIIKKLTEEVAELRVEVHKLHTQTKQQPIYR